MNNANNIQEENWTITSEKIQENYNSVLEKIKFHAEKSGRKSSDIKIVAVTKTFPPEVLYKAYQAGLRIFGENYAQELRDKVKVMSFPDIEWHYIGRIQTNKLKYIVPVATLIHSVYRLEEVEEIDRLAKKHNKVQNVLIEVNVSGEETKGGIEPCNVEKILYKANKFENVKVIGLMTMAPLIEQEETRKYFIVLRELINKLSNDYPELRELSMGMSNDYSVAVEEGSTIVRIGTAIFGERG